MQLRGGLVGSVVCYVMLLYGVAYAGTAAPRAFAVVELFTSEG